MSSEWWTIYLIFLAGILLGRLVERMRQNLKERKDKRK